MHKKYRKVKVSDHLSSKVFYNEGTRLDQDTAKTTRDMAARGFPVTIATSAAALDHEEMRLLSSWQTPRRQHEE